ncbi:MAG: hypothetical protein H9802_04730, partial [Candidatus Phocaeicola faecipullorum]|nr:hypothetical protein [Candidatus Phocaeicola faecipullorum]
MLSSRAATSPCRVRLSASSSFNLPLPKREPTFATSAAFASVLAVRNMQCMMQFFNEYNQELTMVKDAVPSITQPVAAQMDTYNFTLPIKHLDWTHNLILLQQVKDIRARYWYM